VRAAMVALVETIGSFHFAFFLASNKKPPSTGGTVTALDLGPLLQRRIDVAKLGIQGAAETVDRHK